MRVRVLRGIFYGHRPERDPEFDADQDNPVIARGLEHGLLEAVESEVSPIGEAEVTFEPDEDDGASTVTLDVATGEELCGVETSRGTACARPAGWGTGHEGTGHCRYHDKES